MKSCNYIEYQRNSEGAYLYDADKKPIPLPSCTKEAEFCMVINEQRSLYDYFCEDHAAEKRREGLGGYLLPIPQEKSNFDPLEDRVGLVRSLTYADTDDLKPSQKASQGSETPPTTAMKFFRSSLYGKFGTDDSFSQIQKYYSKLICDKVGILLSMPDGAEKDRLYITVKRLQEMRSEFELMEYRA